MFNEISVGTGPLSGLSRGRRVSLLACPAVAANVGKHLIRRQRISEPKRSHDAMSVNGRLGDVKGGSPPTCRSSGASHRCFRPAILWCTDDECLSGEDLAIRVLCRCNRRVKKWVPRAESTEQPGLLVHRVQTPHRRSIRWPSSITPPREVARSASAGVPHSR
jgi:hypothetical protein